MIKKKRILVVDDEKDLVTELTIRLEASGWEVLVAFDGQEGLEKAKKEKPDLLLLDVVMPKLNGYEVCLELKKDPQTKLIPILLLTAKDDEDWNKKSGADDHVLKPYATKLLLEKIKEFLGEQ